MFRVFLCLNIICCSLVASVRDPMLDFITGDAFRSLCQYIYEEDGMYGPNSGAPVDPNIIHCEEGDCIFIQPYSLDRFIKEIHPKIKHPYFIISHNADTTIGLKYEEFLADPKVIKWFGQNIDIDSEKIVPIPIGIEDRYWYFKRTSDPYLIQKINDMDIKRDNYTYLNVVARTFLSERSFVVDHFKHKRFVKKGKYGPFSGYLKDLKKHRFCFSPSGNGIDCHRTWEALLMGCYPIVKPTVKSTGKLAKGNESLYTDLPVIVVKDWREVTPEFLHQKLVEFFNTEFNYDKLYFPYWRDMILSDVNEYKQNQTL